MIKFKLFSLFFLALTINSCNKTDDNDNHLFHITAFVEAILNYNEIHTKHEIEKITSLLYPESIPGDELGHKENLETLNQAINRYDFISSNIVCYACIKTYPAQSELTFTIDSFNYKANRTIDIITPKDATLSFGRLHKTMDLIQ